MKKYLILVLLLILGISGMVSAFPAEIDPIEFNVQVAPWAVVDITNPSLLEITDGSASGVVSAIGTITTNTPWKISFSSTRVHENKDINNWFWYDLYVGNSRPIGTNPGGGMTGYPFKPGVYDIRVDFTVKSTHHIAGFPRPQEWYTLLAGDYHSTAILTIEAR